MLLDTVGELHERVELLRGGRVLADAVIREAEQFAHRAGVGIRITQRPQQTDRAPSPPRRERVGGTRQLLLRLARVAAGELGELFAGFGRLHLAATVRRRTGPRLGRAMRRALLLGFRFADLAGLADL